MRIVSGIDNYPVRRTFESVQEDVVSRTLKMRLYSHQNGQIVPPPWVSDGGEVLLRAAVTSAAGGDIKLYHGSHGVAGVLVATLTFGASANPQVAETAPVALPLAQNDFLYIEVGAGIDTLHACEVERYPKGGVEL